MRYLQIVVLTGLLFASTVVCAEEGFRANYDIKMQQGQEQSRITTRSALSKSNPVIQQIGGYSVQIKLTDVSETRYSIKVVVSEPGALNVPVDVLSGHYEGAFQGMLEFTVENDVLKVDGAIAISRMR